MNKSSGIIYYNKTKMKKVLLGLTTFYSDWQGKIKEASALCLSEIALFLTGLSHEERKELYGLLEKSSIKNIPHVHLRDDMSLSEVEYFIKNFRTEAFNIHPQRSEYIFSSDFEKYSSLVYVENVEIIPSIEELNKYAGLCIDFSHWEGAALCALPAYDKFEALVGKYKIGCAHISAVSAKKSKGSFGGFYTPVISLKI